MFVVSTLFFLACGKNTGSDNVAIPDSPDAAVQTILTEFSEGNGSIAWSALPASYQKDIDEIIHLFGSNVDEEVYNKSFSLFSNLTKLVDQKKSFIVNSSLLKDKSPENLAEMEAALPSIAGLMNAIDSSSLSSTESLRSFSGKSFFETTVSECIKHLEAINKMAGEKPGLADYGSAVVSVVNEDEKQAVLSIAFPDREADQVTFTKIENRWVPADMASKWQENIKGVTDSIKKMSTEGNEVQKTQIMGVITTFEGILLNIESAKTQEEFDQSLKSSAMPLMSVFMLLSQSANNPQ